MERLPKVAFSDEQRIAANAQQRDPSAFPAEIAVVFGGGRALSAIAATNFI